MHEVYQKMSQKLILPGKVERAKSRVAGVCFGVPAPALGFHGNYRCFSRGGWETMAITVQSCSRRNRHLETMLITVPSRAGAWNGYKNGAVKAW